MSKICLKAVVSGKVQGVFYRYTTVQKAKALGDLTGWVRNTDNGQVELIVCGEADIVNKLTDWLWQGSPASNVTNVECEEIPWQELGEFTTVH